MISLDLETTGLDPERHEAWEVGLVDLEDNQEYLWEFPVLRLREADPGALRVNDYYRRNSVPPAADHAIEYAPQQGATVKPHDAAFEIARLTCGRKILGCSVHFDLEFLGRLLQHYDAVPAWHHRVLDLGSFGAGVLGFDRPLASVELGRFSKVQNDDPHTTLGDTRWNVEVYRTLVHRMEAR